jgi:uncharacterized membrane protein YeaQ/YmgE (transglycosylase-associated protein family)
MEAKLMCAGRAGKLGGGNVNVLGVIIPWNWIYWGAVGLIAGWLTGKLTHGRGFGCLGDLFIGLVGAVVGGWIFVRLGVHFYGFFGSLAAATVGAVLLTAIAGMFSGGHRD